WNANPAVIPTLTDANTVILSDELNHASIIDAIRLSRPARKVIYKHSDMSELRAGLQACEPGQRKLIITDGVFSMEGDLARVPEILELARAHDGVVIIDDAHGTGVLGATGRGVAEHFGLLGQVDILTGTLGKALGGAAEGEAAIIPIIVGETAFAIRISERLLEEGIFVTGFGYPVVPEGAARIRVQMSAALQREHLDRAVEAFQRVGREVGLLAS